jgi:hypothetical protein
VERCLVADLQKMLGPEVDDNEEVPLGILSPQNLDLISECALRWRIGPTYRSVCFLDQVKRLYEQADVPLECVPEALQMVTKVMQDIELERWPVSDVRLPKLLGGCLTNQILFTVRPAHPALQQFVHVVR